MVSPEVWVITGLVKSPKLFLVFLDLNNAVVWTVSTHPFISNHPNAALILCWLYRILQLLWVSPLLSRFFSSLTRSMYLSLFSLSFSFTQWSAGTAKSTIRQIIYFLLTITRSGRLAKIKGSVCLSESQRILCV